jgi:hypothetical protein
VEKIWGEVEGFPDYGVSNYGEVKNLRFDRLLRPRVNSYGYLRVALRQDGRTYEKLVHQLVAQVFISGWHQGVIVKHNDEDHSNNEVTNLRLVGGIRLGHFKDHPNLSPIRHLRIIETGQVFRSVSNAARYLECDRSTIYKVLRGDRETHLGYTFEYFEDEAA